MERALCITCGRRTPCKNDSGKFQCTGCGGVDTRGRLETATKKQRLENAAIDDADDDVASEDEEQQESFILGHLGEVLRMQILEARCRAEPANEEAKTEFEQVQKTVHKGMRSLWLNRQRCMVGPSSCGHEELSDLGRKQLPSKISALPASCSMYLPMLASCGWCTFH